MSLMISGAFEIFSLNFFGSWHLGSWIFILIMISQPSARLSYNNK